MPEQALRAGGLKLLLHQRTQIVRHPLGQRGCLGGLGSLCGALRRRLASADFFGAPLQGLQNGIGRNGAFGGGDGAGRDFGGGLLKGGRRRALPLRFLQQLFERQFAGDPLRLVRLVEQAALRYRFRQGRRQQDGGGG